MQITPILPRLNRRFLAILAIALLVAALVPMATTFVEPPMQAPTMTGTPTIDSITAHVKLAA